MKSSHEFVCKQTVAKVVQRVLGTVNGDRAVVLDSFSRSVVLRVIGIFIIIRIADECRVLGGYTF